MAATQYVVFYRHLNDFVSEPVTNDITHEYEELLEFYVDPDHRIFDEDPLIRSEEWTKQQEMVSYGNDATNPKNDMLFVYNGAEKIKHKKWVSDSIGYVVKDWTEIPRDKIGNQGDFSKEFTTIEYSTPEDGGTVVCNEATLKKYMESEILENKLDADGNKIPKTDSDGNIIYKTDKKGKPTTTPEVEQDNSGSIMKTVTSKGWYTVNEIQKAIEDASFWKLTTGLYDENANNDYKNFTLDYKEHNINIHTINRYATQGKQLTYENVKGVKHALDGILNKETHWYMPVGKVYISKNEDSKNKKLIYTDYMNTGNSGTGGTGNISPTEEMPLTTITNRKTNLALGKKCVIPNTVEFDSIESINNIYSSIVIRKEHIETTIIPAHYEYTIDAPYLIKDTYKRIMASPWFVHCVCGSLDAALEKARQLSATHGIENVKLVKRVPFDHFVKIQ